MQNISSNGFRLRYRRRSWVIVASILILLHSAAMHSTFAGFALVDNFESYQTGIEINGQSDGSGTWQTSNQGDYLVDNDQTKAGNQVLNVLSYTAVGGQNEALLDDPKINIANGTVGTFFFRFWRGDPSSDVIFGFIDEDSSSTLADLSWGDFRTQLRNSVTEQNGISVGDAGRRSNLDIRSANSQGSGYANFDIDPLAEGEWFNVWMVVHNDGAYTRLNFLDDSGDYTEVYIQSDVTFPTQTQLADSSGDTKFSFGWNDEAPGFPTSGTEKALNRFFMRNCCGTDTEDAGLENNHTGPWYLDDFYIDTAGINLTNPIQVIPEPSLFALLATGVLSSLSFSRHRSSGSDS